MNDVTESDPKPESQTIHTEGEYQSVAGIFETSRDFTIGGRMWSLEFQQAKHETNSSEGLIEGAIAGLGVLVSLLAASLFGFMANSRQRALSQAKLLTIDLQKTNDELNRSNNDLSQFAHVASHDLQTPVRNVITSVALLEEHLGSDIDSESALFLEYMKKSSNRMLTLVSDLLEYAKLGRDTINFEPVELNDVLRDACESTREIRASSGAQLHVGALPCTNGDSKQLLRVFENLISNSIKYANSERTPLISVQQRPDRGGEIATSGRPAQAIDDIQITVSDNGQGIDTAFHEKVFLPFKRLHRHDEIPGTGLGLGICKQIIERHNGSLIIESSSNEGTTFLITLPAQTDFQSKISDKEKA